MCIGEKEATAMAVPVGKTNVAASPSSPMDRFRLRHFLSKLVDSGELEIIVQPVELADIGAYLDGNPKAVLFRAVGAERAQVVGNVTGSRRRLALAFGVSEQELTQETLRRLANPIAPTEV